MTWTKEKITILKDCYKNFDKYSTEDIAILTKTTPAAVRNKAWRLGLTQPNDWTPEEVKYLKDNYKSYDLMKISRKLGKHKTNVCRKAKQLGIERNMRKKEILKHRGMQYKLWPFNKGIGKDHHPKGMLGKNHSKEYRKEISKRVIEYWENITPKELEVRRIRSIKTKIKNDTLNPNRNRTNAYSRTKSGKREDLNNQFFRSSWEANIARYFNYVGIKWVYEPKVFYFDTIKRGCVSYTPDFYLPDENRWVEIKGWMDDKSKTKLKRFAKFYPNEKLELIGAKEYNEFKKWSRIIPNWE